MDPVIKLRISLLLPTRGRHALVERFFESVAETAAQLGQIEVIIYVDEDDVDSHNLDSHVMKVTRIIGPRASMGIYNSICYEAAQGDIIMLVNDDMVIRTPGWDEKLIECDAKYPNKIYLAYGNDLFKNGRLCTFPILSRRTCELLVEPYPKEYEGAFIDYHLFDIFKRLKHAGFDRIHYIDDVVFEHLHYRTGKAPFDETYAKRGRFADDSTFLTLINSRKKSADRLLRILRGDESRVLYSPERGTLEKVPKTLFKAILAFTQYLLFDRGLPLRWRSYLWVWFIGRYMAGRGMLWPFVR
jgi:hypothetical protein